MSASQKFISIECLLSILITYRKIINASSANGLTDAMNCNHV